MWKKYASLAVLGSCAMLGGAAMQLGLHFATPKVYADPEVKNSLAVGLPMTADVAALSERFSQIAYRVGQGVFSVTARKIDTKGVANRDGKTSSNIESGSGVLVRFPNRPGIFGLTSNHVIETARANDIVIQLHDGKLLQPKKVWNYGPADVALLWFDDVAGIETVPLGNSDAAQAGNLVLAVGSPLGLNQSVTHGIISAVGRNNISLGVDIQIKDFIQTDAAINQGSSGGPLVNLKGEVIGINTAIASPNGSFSGVSFSMPINQFRRIADQLLDKGTVSRGYLGLQLKPEMEPMDALRLGLDRNLGAIVEDVHSQSPAAQAGVRVGDVILEINNQPIRNETHFINIVSQLPTNKSAMIVLWRDRKRVAMSATVADWNQFSSKFDVRGKQ